MRATLYSSGFCHDSKPALLVCFAVSALLINASAQTNSNFTKTNTPAQSFAARAETVFRAAQKKSRSEPRNNEAAWKYARAAFDFAEFAKNDEKREQIASEGIYACRQVIEREHTNAAAHYYLAMNLGQVARTKSVGALKIVNEMEREWGLAGSFDEKFDYAGADRNLGLLYLETPGWPVSIGSRSKAKQHLQRAVELAPNYPENHLNLMDAYLKWSDRKKLEREIKTTEELWPKAKMEFAGEEWESSWADWGQRWKKIKAKAGEIPKPVKSPADDN